MNNTDLQVRFNKETKQQVLQTGKQMNLYYTDEYVRWLEDIALKQANGAKASEATAILPHVSNSVCFRSNCKQWIAKNNKCAKGDDYDCMYRQTDC